MKWDKKTLAEGHGGEAEIAWQFSPRYVNQKLDTQIATRVTRAGSENSFRNTVDGIAGVLLKRFSSWV